MIILLNYAVFYNLQYILPNWFASPYLQFLTLIFLATLLIVISGSAHGDFDRVGSDSFSSRLFDGVRFVLFQVVSIITTTGFATHDFDKWSDFGRGSLFILMFIGGCAGSTGGGLKVIRHILFLKTLRLELERAFRPNVVRPLTLGGSPLDDQEIGRNTLIYFSFILLLFANSWLVLITIEPDSTWGANHEHKLIDSSSAVAATVCNHAKSLK